MTDGIGKKTILAQRMIVRYIWDHRLKPGDRLPSCSAISKALNLGAATVFNAVKQLQSEGVLAAKDKVGIFVNDPKTPGHAGYRTALLIGRRETSPFNSFLSVYIQTEFAANGCVCRMFPGRYRVGTNTYLEDGFKAHAGVKQCLERGEFDGLIVQMALSPENMNELNRRGIPFCLVGGFLQERGMNSVTVSMESLARLGTKRLAELGFRHPAFLCPGGFETDSAAKLFLDLAGNGSVISSPSFLVAEQTAEKLLKIPEKQRPDSLLIPDDMVARGIYSTLVQRNGLGYLPHPVVLSAKEYPLYLPVPADILEMSIEEIAHAAVLLLKEAMQNPSVPLRQVFVKLEERFLRCFDDSRISRS